MQFFSSVKTWLESTKEDWIKLQSFQDDVVDNAWHRLNTRLVGWMTHHGVWETQDKSEEQLEKIFRQFEMKHLKAYKRWKKNSKVKELNDSKDKTEPRDINKRLDRLFIYYLIYGEIHDFRGQKSVFHLLFHMCFQKFVQGKLHIGEWLRQCCHDLYKIMLVVYSKEEMNQSCFHHDDLDDLCSSHSFLKHLQYQSGELDFLGAFNLNEDGKFPHLFKLIQLPTWKVIKYWAKGAQAALTDTDQNERDQWILDNFLVEGSKENDEIKQLTEDSCSKLKELPEAEEQSNDSKRELNLRANRWKPSEEDFEDKPDMLQSYRMANLQFETAKELSSMAQKTLQIASGQLQLAKVEYFRDRKHLVQFFVDGEKLYDQVIQNFNESFQGFENSAQALHNLEDCQGFELEVIHLKDQAWYNKVKAERELLGIKKSKLLQLSFLDVMNKERSAFADNWKTYIEKSGGWLGLSGYLTIFQHYKGVVYLHLFLLFPLFWLYFEYQTLIDVNNFGNSVIKLVAIGTIYELDNNLLLPFGFIVGLLVLTTLMFNLLRWRLQKKSVPRRDLGCRKIWNFKAKALCFLLWFFTIITEIIVMKTLVIDPIKAATIGFIEDWVPAKSIPLLIIHWLPTLVLYFSSLQFIYTLWVGTFGFFLGLKDKAFNTIHWSQVISSFEETVDMSDGTETKKIPAIVEYFCKSSLPETKESLSPSRKVVAFAKMWNSVIGHFYEIHKVNKEELQRLSYKIKLPDPKDYLSGTVEKVPELRSEPQVKEVKEHLVRLINNLKMPKPTNKISVKEMLPLTVVTPVGAEKILYPYDYITHIDNTQNSFLQHLIESSTIEWENFKSKECASEKARDWVERMEKDIMQGAQPDQDVKSKKKKSWIHNSAEGQVIKRKVCIWASIRFQALYRTLHGFMQVPKALEILARVQDPKMTQFEAEELVHTKFSYLVGYQSFAAAEKIYKQTKHKIKEGKLTKAELEAHEIIINIKQLKESFPEVKIAYPDEVDGKFVARMSSGLAKSSSSYFSYSIDMFGPFGDMGLGKPAHQNFLSQFIDGMIVQTIDVNQDNVLSQSFFIPNVLAEFENDDTIKIIGCPEFVITAGWSSTAWCSAFSEHTFGTLVQRCYARLGVRLHYGHPDFIDALFVMSETGLSKLPYVSEDIFTGFDTVMKGGRIIHIEYHEVGKARDVDLYTTTKFMRKISMGASQMACSRYIQQLQSSKNVSYFQGLSFYYSTSGFYINHLLLYLSVWFALASQLVLIMIQHLILKGEISSFITNRIFAYQIGLTLVAPGVLQLWLEKGLLPGSWEYIKHFPILAVYSTFHILNISNYWQWGLVHSAFYLPSGRGTGLEHYFMKDLYESFYRTHWRTGFLIFWMGIFALILGGSIFVFFFMYLLPSGIWLWGATFLNPGSLPSTVHEEQWKRLINRDMQETREIVRLHANVIYMESTEGGKLKHFCTRLWRNIQRVYQLVRATYTFLNFAIHMRAIRGFGLLALIWGYVFTEKIPTFIFTDERRRILRWDEEESRQKSIFMSSKIHLVENGGSTATAPSTPVSLLKIALSRANSRQKLLPEGQTSRQLPTPPEKKMSARKRSVRFFTRRKSTDSTNE